MLPSSVSLGIYSRPHVTQTAEGGPPFLCVGFDAQIFKPIDHADMMPRVLPQRRAFTPTLTMTAFNYPSRKAIYAYA